MINNIPLREAEARTIIELTLAEYAAVRMAYYNNVYDAVDGYLSASESITQYKKDFHATIANSYTLTAGISWKDGNGDFIIGVAGVAALLATRIEQEQGHVSALFERLKLLRADLGQDGEFVVIREARARAEGYARSLDYWYALVKLMALNDTPLMFGGLSGNESCPECEMLMGTWHKASWYVSHGYVPPKGENLTCAPGGLCEHVLIAKNGMLVTL